MCILIKHKSNYFTIQQNRSHQVFQVYNLDLSNCSMEVNFYILQKPYINREQTIALKVEQEVVTPSSV